MMVINGKMSPMEMALAMGEGNPGAMTVIVEMFGDPVGLMNTLMLDQMNIRGTELYMLYNDCCDRDWAKFDRTIMMLRSGVFTQEQIRTNLSRVRALPFIDDTVKMDGIPSYDEDFGPSHPKWGEWCQAQRESFELRSAAL